MSDPIGLISGGGGTPIQPRPSASGADAPRQGPSFADYLKKNLDEVNGAQQDATRAVEDLMSGERTDLEGVILATEKADTAFRMLQQMRNKVMAAYEEVKQIRV